MAVKHIVTRGMAPNAQGDPAGKYIVTQGLGAFTVALPTTSAARKQGMMRKSRGTLYGRR